MYMLSALPNFMSHSSSLGQHSFSGKAVAAACWRAGVLSYLSNSYCC